MFEKVLIILNAVICSVIFVRCFHSDETAGITAQRGMDSRLILSYSASVPVRAYFDPVYHADITSVISNLLICAAVLVYRGNVMSFLKRGDLCL